MKTPQPILPWSKGWTAFVNECLAYFHKNGVQKDDILNFIHGMPYVEGAIDMIKKLKNDLNADIIIISDANSIYIQESLVNIGLRWEKLFYLRKQGKIVTPIHVHSNLVHNLYHKSVISNCQLLIFISNSMIKVA